MDGRSPKKRAVSYLAASCQVRHCRNDIPLDKAFFAKHRICPHHASVPEVVIDGKRVRFCQLCRRFQPISDFEGDRKSCRKVLLQHNNRRRRNKLGAEAQVPSSRSGDEGDKSSEAAPKQEPTDSGSQRTVPGRIGSSTTDLAALEQQEQQEQQEQEPAGSRGGSAGPAPAALLPPASADVSSTMVNTYLLDAELQGVLARLPHPAGALAGLQQQLLPQEQQDGPRLIAQQRQQQQQQQMQGGLTVGFTEAGADPLGWAAQPQLGGDASNLLQTWAARQGQQQGQQRHLMPAASYTAGPAPAARAQGQAMHLAMAGEAAVAAAATAQQQQQQQQQHRWQGQAQEQRQQGQQGQLGAAEMSQAQPILAHSPLLRASSSTAPLPEQAPLPPPFSSWPVKQEQQQRRQEQQQPSGWAGIPQLQLRQASPGPRADQQLNGVSIAAAVAAAGPPPAVAIGTHRSSTTALQGPWPNLLSLQHMVMPPSPAQRPPLDAQDHAVRLSLKLFNVTPDQLPEGLRQATIDIVTADPLFLDSVARPGCTVITVEAVVTSAERDRLSEAGAAGVARQLLQLGGWQGGEDGDGSGRGEAWAEDMLVQVGDQVVIVREGQVVTALDVAGMLPQLLAARPAAILADGCGADTLYAAHAAHTAHAAGQQATQQPQAGGLEEGQVGLWGHGIADPATMVVCRQGGRVLDLEVLGRGRIPSAVMPPAAAGTPLPEWVLVRPLGVGVGLLQFEVQRGGLLSAPISVVALPTRAAVAEAQQAQRALAGTPHGETFLSNLGWVLSAHHLQLPEHAQQPELQAGTSAHSRVGPARAGIVALGLFVAASAHGWAELVQLLASAVGCPGSSPLPFGLAASRSSAQQLPSAERSVLGAANTEEGPPQLLPAGELASGGGLGLESSSSSNWLGGSGGSAVRSPGSGGLYACLPAAEVQQLQQERARQGVRPLGKRSAKGANSSACTSVSGLLLSLTEGASSWGSQGPISDWQGLSNHTPSRGSWDIGVMQGRRGSSGGQSLVGSIESELPAALAVARADRASGGASGSSSGSPRAVEHQQPDPALLEERLLAMQLLEGGGEGWSELPASE